MTFIRKIVFIFIILAQTCAFSQSETAYSFIVAGHAYGAHSGTNLGLHPPLLNSLNEGLDPKTAFIVLTGDIVNSSTTESWAQVESELTGLGLDSYYVMGNHDNNGIGYDVFNSKHGGDYYAFSSQTELYIVLNSTESDRSVSATQLTFMEEQIDQADASIQNIFVFFHEVIWNSKEKYSEVRSNSRSRYVSMVDHSNYWEEVHPICVARPSQNFYMISGDVGGNPDAIAIFYDTCNNVTLISSGMGEVDDENYLLVKVINKDSIVFEPVALTAVDLDPIEYYSVPLAPDTILYSYPITRENLSVEFSVPDILNADTYIWHLPAMTSGVSITNTITLEFEEGFHSGDLSVSTARDGYGLSPLRTISLEMISTGSEMYGREANKIQLKVLKSNEMFSLLVGNIQGEEILVHILDLNGRVIMEQSIVVSGRDAEIQLQNCDLPKGINLVTLSTKNQNIAKKILIH